MYEVIYINKDSSNWRYDEAVLNEDNELVISGAGFEAGDYVMLRAKNSGTSFEIYKVQ